VKIFEKLNKKTFGTNLYFTSRSKIVNKKLFSLLTKMLLKNFHGIFGLVPPGDPYPGGFKKVPRGARYHWNFSIHIDKYPDILK